MKFLIKYKKIFIFAGIAMFFAASACISVDESEARSEIVEKRTWNSKSYTTEVENKFTAEFHGKWIHYLGENGWEDIDTSFSEVEGGFAMTDAPFEMFVPRYSTGTAVFHNNNKWNLFEKEEINSAPIDMKVTAMDVNIVEGKVVRGDLLIPEGIMEDVNYVVYEGAYPEGDLIYYVHFGVAPRLEKLIRINEKPSRLKYKFELEYSDPVVFEMANGETWNKEGRLETDGQYLNSWKEGDNPRGISFRQFKIWDSNLDFLELVGESRNLSPIQSTFDYLGDNKYILTKDLPEEFFDTKPVYPVFTDTESTFYPDADPESTSVDGYGFIAAETSWSTARNATSGSVADGVTSTTFVGTLFLNPEYYLYRGYFLFDTSSIDDAATIDTAKISFYVSGHGDQESTYYRVTSVTTSSNTSLTGTDYNQSNFGGTSFASKNTADITTGAYNDWTFGSSGISHIDKTGVTKFGIRNGKDIDNTAPLDQSTISGRFAEYTGTSQDPKLVITVASPTLEQAEYRWFKNDNSTDVGSTLAAESSVATTTGTDTVRLRMLLHTTGASLSQNGETLKLQYAEKSGTCDTSFIGETYADVLGGSGAIQFSRNATPSGGDFITPNNNDPTHSTDTTIYQTYVDQNTFTNASTTAIAVGEDGMWDFSLVGMPSAEGNTYCFRVIKSDDTNVDTYTVIPELAIIAPKTKMRLRTIYIDHTDWYSSSYAHRKSITVSPTGAGWQDVDDSVYDNKSYSFTSESSNAKGIEFNDDGTKMYMATGNFLNSYIYQYTLSVAYDVSTASYDSVSLNVTSEGTAADSIRFKTDGTKMYVTGQSGASVHQYSLSSAWDLSTASYDSVSYTSSEETNLRGLFIKSDGTKMYLVGNNNDTVYQYTLSTAWDVSSASYDSKSKATTDDVSEDVYFSSDGTRMYVAGWFTANGILQFNLSTPWDVSTAAYSVTLSTSSQDGDPASITFKTDGTKMYILGDSNNNVYQYTSSLVNVADDLTDFPMLLNLSDSDLSSNALSTGEDITFTSSDGTTKLAHEIESYSAGELWAWVKVPSMSSTTDTTLYMYYGGPAGSSDPAEVWTNGYVGVWHLGEDGNTTSNGYKDSSPYGNHGTGTSMTAASDVSGKLGTAQDFDGSADYIEVSNSSSLDLTTSSTLEAWVNFDSGFTSDYRSILYAGDSGASYNLLTNITGGQIRTWFASTALNGDTAMSNGTWTKMVSTYDNSNINIYLNGSSDGSTAKTGSMTTGLPVTIGSTNAHNAYFFTGVIDEVRISNVTRSSGWISTEYNNQSATSTFYTIGTEESRKTSNVLRLRGIRLR